MSTAREQQQMVNDLVAALNRAEGLGEDAPARWSRIDAVSNIIVCPGGVEFALVRQPTDVPYDMNAWTWAVRLVQAAEQAGSMPMDQTYLVTSVEACAQYLVSIAGHMREALQRSRDRARRYMENNQRASKRMHEIARELEKRHDTITVSVDNEPAHRGIRAVLSLADVEEVMHIFVEPDASVDLHIQRVSFDVAEKITYLVAEEKADG